MPIVQVEEVTIEEVETTLRKSNLAGEIENLTPAELRALAEIVLSMMRSEMRIERERLRRDRHP
jgi:hypothetical protein